MSDKLMVQVPASMEKLAAAMTALVDLVEAQVTRSAAIGPSAYDAFEAAVMDRVAAIECAAHEPALSALDIDAPAVTIDGRRFRRVLRSPGDYHSRAGSVSVTRTLYREAGKKDATSLDTTRARLDPAELAHELGPLTIPAPVNAEEQRTPS